MDGESTDIVRSGKHMITFIFTKRLGQYLRNCSATIDRVVRRKDTNMLCEWRESRGFQCKDDWKE